MTRTELLLLAGPGPYVIVLLLDSFTRPGRTYARTVTQPRPTYPPHG